MQARNTSQFILQQFKESGVDFIQPSGCVRFVKSFIDKLPPQWASYNRDQLISEISKLCDYGASTGKLIRKRRNDVKGYIYEIK
jgi:hypothetical protein